MKKIVLCSFLLLAINSLINAQNTDWQIAGESIRTPWADKVDPAHPLPDYPRPQLVRKDWMNLNGLWQYTIQPKSQEGIPVSYMGNILVPFAVESALSGVGKTVGRDSVLWYHVTATLPSSFKGKKVLLHFGAVDWSTEVFVNGKKAGTHLGGFDPFTIDITPALKKGGRQEIAVRVWDPTDDGPQPRGKQVKKPQGIWYTPVTGIWQTVWLEPVATTYIAGTKQTPDIDKKTVTIEAVVNEMKKGDVLQVQAFDGETMIAGQEVPLGEPVQLSIPSPKLWSPSNPFLYSLRVSVIRNGKVADEIQSYFAMRKISMAKDDQGIQRILLNHEFVFQYGPLDQGWWPDGLYTAPTEEAMIYDIRQLKDMGCNMIRKHIKVEPARYYYQCDKMGMLVWQDMPSGDMEGYAWEPRPGVVGKGAERIRTPESEKIYRHEWNAIIDALYNFPSIVVWVPFNEAWGQFKTIEITNWTMQKDPSRLVNSASGGNFYPVGHIIDLHDYPDPAMPDPAIYGATRAIVLGEFGGLGLPVKGHTWEINKVWGYQSFKTGEELLKRYEGLINHLAALIPMGLSAAVYTQTTDVEGEVNGFMTYDRKLVKMPVEDLRKINSRLFTVPVVIATGKR